MESCECCCVDVVEFFADAGVLTCRRPSVKRRCGGGMLRKGVRGESKVWWMGASCEGDIREETWLYRVWGLISGAMKDEW